MSLENYKNQSQQKASRPTQQKFGAVLKDNRSLQSTVSRVNQTGLPDALKSGIESISGYSLDAVRVHYNSSQPAQLSAHAFARGTDIHLAPGQEKHLPHEAWHAVQQLQGRVHPTFGYKGSFINDELSLEREAEQMGAKAIQQSATAPAINQLQRKTSASPAEVYQLAIDISTWVSTAAHHLYYIDPAVRTILLSQEDAPAPQPRALYAEQSVETTNNDDAEIEMNSWKPRSNFLIKIAQNDDAEEAVDEDANEQIQVQDLADKTGAIRALIDDRDDDDGLRLGTTGKNDCLGYATTLKVLIAKYAEQQDGMIGETWQHDATDDAPFNYHAATVVAQDGGDAVTLEAHSSKILIAPQFHIRPGGKAGFEAENKAGYEGQFVDEAQIVNASVDQIDLIHDQLADAWKQIHTIAMSQSSIVVSNPLIENVVGEPEVVATSESDSGSWLKLGLVLAAAVAGMVLLLKLKK